MLSKDDIKQLSTLARVAISDGEEEGLAKDLDAVLGYVGEVSKVATDADTIPRAGDLRNIMREDKEPYPGGTFTEAIVKNMPASEDGYLKVKQIL